MSFLNYDYQLRRIDGEPSKSMEVDVKHPFVRTPLSSLPC